jgi:UDP-N-acetyl-D-mannosaminuronic acid dehydrogenase
LTFKPDTSDLRGSPALEIITELNDTGFDVVAVDPYISEHPEVTLTSMDIVLGEAELIVVLVKHREFLEPMIQEALQKKNVLDFCGALPSN